ncbi:beta-lactamase/transpeptidase-like protein [Podospora aff. communis PSN243]|uniref:Beta-lactamase/transpeptidase-like protein n=1 Tax=Podospora aff. communis PSN243 TaxID=3040156 RepID=A0AAV9G2N2_9PEZI|nr:beta-lactamase/transpeptidase-like protein [Podospora aff. communis PSN243]
MGPSLSEVRERLDALRGQIQVLVNEAATAGLSVGVLHEGTLVHTSHYGYQNLREKESPNDDTVYHLASLSKALVAAGLGVLVDEGKLSWDTRLVDIDLSPRFHQRDKEVEAHTTIRDILAHRMGLSMRMNYWAQMEQELLLPPNEAINVLGDLNKLADFRTTIKYNNWTYAVAALIIEKLAGKSVEEFMQETFFRPLGLTRTTFASTPADNCASAHITLSDGTPFEVPSPRIGNGTLLCGAAGMKSSIRDSLVLYDAFLSALEDQTSTGLSSTPGNPIRKAVDLFTTQNKKGTTEYGLGWFLTELPADIGWIGINDGRVKENPIIAIVILGNTLAFADLPDYVGGLILNTILGSDDEVDFVSLVRECKAVSINAPLKTAAQLRAEKKEGTTHLPLESYVGRYVNSMGNLALTVTVLGDAGLRLRLNDLPGTYYDLKHYHDDVFAWDCDRDAEVKRVMFPQLSVEFRKIYFKTDGEGVVKAIHWAYARDEPKGEEFLKQE